jgi:hypothetical protein
MANEIHLSAQLSVQNGTLNASQDAPTVADQTTPGVIQIVQNIGTSEETVAFTGLTAARAALFKNLGPTNYVDIGPDSTGMVGLIRLKAGESCVLTLKPAVTVKAQANTAAIDLAIMAAET